VVILTTLTLEAKVFRNAYVAFELPDTWKCTLEHTEWVCRSEASNEAKEAIIILTAKEVGPTDSFDAYTQHLNTIQTGPAGQSRIVYPPKQVKINDQVWIDGLHMGSEVRNYFTRYLATIKDRIAILVTFSAHKNFYTKYSQDFFKSIQSLRVIATKNLLDHPETGALRPGGETIGTPIGSAMPADMTMQEGQGGGANSSQGQKTKMMLMGIAILLAGVAIYIFVKMKQK
jgi:hypothetical protein